MKRKHPIEGTIVEGIIFLLPVIILILLYKWIYSFIVAFVSPLSYLLFLRTDILFILITALIFILVCYFIGISHKTKLGKWILGHLNRVLTKLPGYGFILGVVIRIFKNNASRFSSVVLVDLFGKGTLVTGFITDDHESGRKTVFVPTGPNPTSGMIYHVQNDRIHHIDVSVEDTMRTIISCGHGSKKLVDHLKKKIKK